MDTKLLEDALALLEQKNLTAAAAKRNMTQPAFSRRIQALERWVGQELLTRQANRVELSSDLIESAPQIRALLAQVAQLQEHLRNPQMASRALVMAAPHALSASAAVDILKRANSEETPWHIHLVTRNQDEAISLFLNREADVLLSYENRAVQQMPFDASVLRHVWRPDAFVPVVGGNLRHTLGHAHQLPDDAPTIAYPAGSMFGKIISQHEASRSARLPRRASVDSTFSIGVANLVRAGVGAAWVPQCLIMPDILSGDVVILSQEYGRIPMEIAVYTAASNSAATQFLQPVLRSTSVKYASPHNYSAAQTSAAVPSSEAGSA